MKNLATIQQLSEQLEQLITEEFNNLQSMELIPDNLTDDNFLIYAMKCYNTPHCIMSEFESDIKRTKYLKRLFRKYKITKILKERLILNHIIVLSNVFGIEATVKMLFLKLNEDQYPILKTFLLFLNYLPKMIQGVNGKNINSSDITVDIQVGIRLRSI